QQCVFKRILRKRPSSTLSSRLSLATLLRTPSLVLTSRLLSIFLGHCRHYAPLRWGSRPHMLAFGCEGRGSPKGDRMLVRSKTPINSSSVVLLLAPELVDGLRFKHTAGTLAGRIGIRDVGADCPMVQCAFG